MREGGQRTPWRLYRAEVAARAQHRKARIRQRGLLPGTPSPPAARTTTCARARRPGAGSLTAASTWRARSTRPSCARCWPAAIPHDDAQLVRGPGGGRARTPGFDLTFSRAQVGVAAVTPSAIPSSARPSDRAPTSAPWTRRSATSRSTPPSFAAATTGPSACPALGLVAAGFRHRASRAGDPALHTHVLVANLAQDARGPLRGARLAGDLPQRQDRRLRLPGKSCATS